MFDTTAFGALIRQKRGDLGLTQAALALKVFGAEARKSDISKFEKARKTPQEDTVQKLCLHLGITQAEMVPIREARPSAAQLDNIEGLSERDTRVLAAQFNLERPFEQPVPALKALLEQKAADHRHLLSEIDALRGASERIDNMRGAAKAALEALDYDEANHLIENAREIIRDQLREPIALNARLSERQAEIALVKGEVEVAYTLLSAAADSVAALDPELPARIRLIYEDQLYSHGLRYGGQGLALAERMIRAALATLDEDETPLDWATAKNALAVALQNQGIRTEGPDGTALLAEAVTGYRDALRVFTEADHSLNWAKTTQNLAIALQAQGIRTQGPEGTALLAEAVTGYRDALRVFTEADHSLNWATTTQNLAYALQTQGTRTKGPNGTALLAEAVTAYHDALRVRTEADHPQQWAMTQENLSIAEEAIADHNATDDPFPHLRAALAHVDAALTVFDPIHTSYYHEQATRLRDRIRARLAALD